MKRRSVVLAALIMMVATICSSAVWAESKKTLTVLWFNDANESNVFMNTMADYQKNNPNIVIDMQVIPFNDYENKLKMMIAGGNAPDVARLASAHVPLFATTLEPLSGKKEFD